MIRKAIIILLTLAALGTGLLWIGSHLFFEWDYRGFPLRDGGKLNVWSVPGCAAFGTWVPAETPVGDWESHCGLGQGSSGLPAWIVLGMRWGEASGGKFWIATCSYWLLFILFAAYPTRAFIRGRLRRRRRRKKGLCIQCGYNLTGNVSGVCPECGTPA